MIFRDIKTKMETRPLLTAAASTGEPECNDVAIQESPESPSIKKLRKENELAIKHKLVKELFEERSKIGTKGMGLITSLVNKYNKAGYSFVTVPSVKHYIKKLKDTPVVALHPSDVVISNENESESSLSSISPDCSSGRKKGGRPLGTSQELKAAIIKAVDSATTECARRYKEVQTKAKAAGSNYSKRGTLALIIKETESKYGLLNGTIKEDTIKKRALRNNLTGYKYQSTSPVAKVEPILVEYCIRLSKIGKALDKKQVLLLVNSLIENNNCAKLVIAWKSLRGCGLKTNLCWVTNGTKTS
jgi:hypothetical protein